MTTPLRIVGTLAFLLVGSDPLRPAPGEPVAPEPGLSSFLELRIYETKEGLRDPFLSHFEEHYLESQEELGMRIWGQFRDLRAPDQFVWMRGFRTMEERQAGLLAFYTGAVWTETGARVREMMAERATHVHLLEPAAPGDGFDQSCERDEAEHPTGVVVALVFGGSGARTGRPASA